MQCEIWTDAGGGLCNKKKTLWIPLSNLLNNCTWFLYSNGNDLTTEHGTMLYTLLSQYANTLCVGTLTHAFWVRASFPEVQSSVEAGAWTCRLLPPFVCVLLKRTATITQAGVGSQTLRSGTVAFNHCVAPSKSRIYLHQ